MKEEQKCINYRDLNYEIAGILKMRNLEKMPLVIGALGTVAKHYK